jgi:hypothetical protein
MKSISLCFCGFILSFIVVRHLFPGGIMFYQGIALAVITGATQAWIARKTLGQSPGNALKDGLLALLLAYSFMFTIPTTVDRSYSVKLIGELGRAPQGLRKDQLESLFSVDFVRHGAVTRRIEEQTKSGIVEERGSLLHLTRFGRFINVTFDLACTLFSCRVSPAV